MAVLEHTHPIAKNGKNTHIDSFGKEFGSDEHSATVAEFSWPDELTVTASPAIAHSHRHIDEGIEPNSRTIVWQYRPHRKNDEDRKIGTQESANRLRSKIAEKKTAIEEQEFIFN